MTDEKKQVMVECRVELQNERVWNKQFGYTSQLNTAIDNLLKKLIEMEMEQDDE